MNSLTLAYLQFNTLLLVSFVFWLIINSLVQKSTSPLPYSIQLKSARYLFLAVIMAGIAIPISNTSALRLPAPLLEITITENLPIGELLADTSELTELPAIDAISEAESLTLILLQAFCITVFLLQLYYLLYQLMLLHKIIKNAYLWKNIGQIEIFFSERVKTPFSTRVFFRKQIILPYSLIEESENLSIVIKHELQHHRNGDLHWAILLELVKLISPWNIAVYLWKNAIDCLQEYSCDEAVINQKQICKKQYKHCLLDVATSYSYRNFATCSNMVPGLAFLKSPISQLNRRFLKMDLIKSCKKSKLKLFTQAMSLGLGVICSSILVYAQQNQDIELSGPTSNETISERIEKAVTLSKTGAFTSSLNILEPIYLQFESGELDERDSYALLMSYFGLYTEREDFARAATYLDRAIAEDFSHISEESKSVLNVIKERTLDSANRKPLSPLHTEQPAYPEDGVVEEATGWVLVESGIDEDGLVVNPVVQDNCLTSSDSDTECDANTTLEFIENSIDAINKFTFNPYLENGVASTYDGIKYLFRFDLPESIEN